MRTNGLHILSPKGDFVVNPVHVVNNPKDVGEVDTVILGVKAWQVPEVAETIRPLIGTHTRSVRPSYAPVFNLKLCRIFRWRCG